jgi:putative ABC transport system substrate-binding protein
MLARCSDKSPLPSINSAQIKQLLIGKALTLLCLIPWLVGCEPTQPPPEHHHIGIINTVPNLKPVVDGFKQGMVELGHVEGKDITYHTPTITKGHANIEQVVREIEEQGVDLILATTTVTTRKVIALTNTPVIFAPTMDPVKSGLAKSFSHPGGTATGVRIGRSCSKALEWLQQVAPRIKRVFVPHHPKHDGAIYCLEDLEQGAEKLGMALVIKTTETKPELASALQNPPDGIDAIWLLNSPFLASHTKLYVDSAIKHKLPLGSATSQYKSGVLLSYGHMHEVTGKKASELAHKVLTGHSPADLPVQTADFFLGLNLKTAKTIGIEVPPHVLRQAADIIH